MENQSVFIINQAEELISKRNFSSAIVLLLEGLVQYPDYSAIYILLISTLLQASDYEQALHYSDVALSKFPFNKTFKQLHKKIVASMEVSREESDSTNLEQLPHTESINNSESDTLSNFNHPPEDDYKYISSNEIEDVDLEIDNSNELIIEDLHHQNFLKLVTTQDSQLDYNNYLRASNLNLIPGLALAPLKSTKKYVNPDRTKQLPNFPPFPVLPKKKFDFIISNTESAVEQVSLNTNPFVTETMAKIYVSQGAIEEAINAYTILAENKPEKSVEYHKIIDSLKNRN